MTLLNVVVDVTGNPTSYKLELFSAYCILDFYFRLLLSTIPVSKLLSPQGYNTLTVIFSPI